MTQRVRRGEIKLLYTSPETLLRPETLVLLDQAAWTASRSTRRTASRNGATIFGPNTGSLARAAPAIRRSSVWPSPPRPRSACAATSARSSASASKRIRSPASTGRTCCWKCNRASMAWRRRSPSWKAHRDQSGIIYCSTRKGVEQSGSGTTSATVGRPHLTMPGWTTRTRRATRRTSRARSDADHRRHHRLRYGHQQVQRALRAALQPARLAGELLSGDRPGGPRWATRRLPAPLQPGRPPNAVQVHRRGRCGRTGRAAGASPRRWPVMPQRTSCRRIPLLAYFGEEAETENCGFCDGCRDAAGEVAQVDVSGDARLFLGCVLHTGEVFGAAHITACCAALRRAKSGNAATTVYPNTPRASTVRRMTGAAWPTSSFGKGCWNKIWPMGACA